MINSLPVLETNSVVIFNNMLIIVMGFRKENPSGDTFTALLSTEEILYGVETRLVAFLSERNSVVIFNMKMFHR